MKYLLSSIAVLLLILPACSNADPKKTEVDTTAEKKVIQPLVEGKDSLQLRIDSLTALYNNALVTLDSLVGVKNSLKHNDPELDKEIKQQKREAGRIMAEMDPGVVVDDE